MKTEISDRKAGITQSIRQRLNFLDERLWKRFLARRLELIDSLDLSFKKASEQEEDIKKVAETLRLEFLYGQNYYSEFDKLVRAAIQSVRRNRKRSAKTTRSTKRAKVEIPSDEFNPTHLEFSEDKSQISENLPRSGEPGSKFISEIAHLNTDSNDSVYDMSYSTKTSANEDRSLKAIDSIIKPANLSSKPQVKLPSLYLEDHGPVTHSRGNSKTIQNGTLHNPNLQNRNLQNLNCQNQNPQNQNLQNQNLQNQNLQNSHRSKKLQNCCATLLALIKRSKLCLEASVTPTMNNDTLCNLGNSGIRAVSHLMFETSFSDLSYTSTSYLMGKIQEPAFLASFYHKLEPQSPVILDDDTAATTLQTLLGCCIKDFGFDAVLNPVGEAFYNALLQDYPLAVKSTLSFSSQPLHSQNSSNLDFLSSLSGLATVASEMLSGNLAKDFGLSKYNVVEQKTEMDGSKEMPGLQMSGSETPGTEIPRPTLECPAQTSQTVSEITTSNFIKTEPDTSQNFDLPMSSSCNVTESETKGSDGKKLVILRFLTKKLEFSYPLKTSAPPRFVELVENAKQAFKLNSSQVYGLKASTSGLVVRNDSELENIFAKDTVIDLEIFAQRSHAVPIHQITSTIITNNLDKPIFILPPPIRLASPPVIPTQFKQPVGVFGPQLVSKFQPLL